MNVPTKLLAGCLLLLAVGMPVLDTWRALFLAAGLLALVFGTSRTERWRLAAAASLVLAVVGLKAVLPRADIAEAHNAFLVIHDSEALQQELPKEVFANWKAQFDALYPPDREPYTARSQWRQSGAPKTLFTQSADAIWRQAKYTRQVDAIEFHNLGEFRGGFANEIQYNFWAGELLREQMPFYVMYELTPASVGGRLKWQGQLFWEQGNGRFEEINHAGIAERSIASQDVGRRVYAAFFPKRDPNLYFEFEPSIWLRLAAWLEALLSAAGVVAVLVLTIRVRWGAYLRSASIFAVAYVLMVSFLAVSEGKYLGRAYPPQGGGDDGLSHDHLGRSMAMLAGRGEFAEALKGDEAVYWATPGTRYFRMVEKLVFGDTNLLYALVVPCVPVIVFWLLLHLVPPRWAWALTGLFCVLVVGNFSYLNYIANAKLGYGEALAGGLFLLGLTLLLHTQPEWGGTTQGPALIWIAGAALACSMFVRPNFALAVVWLGVATAWVCLRRRDTASFLAFGSGLALALWMPFHNWFYGHELYLISKAGATVSVSLGIGDYGSALKDLLNGRTHTTGFETVVRQVTGWLWSPGLLVRPQLTMPAWAVHPVKLLALIVTCWVAVRAVVSRFTHESALGVVAVASLLAHVPMLFIFTTHYRYAMLAWDLSIVVLAASLIRRRHAHLAAA